jgi:hypothetical protein
MDHGVIVLARTPGVLKELLDGLPEAWTKSNEGPETWTPYDVVGHLIHGERTDWIPRARLHLAESGPKIYEPFDRFAQFRESRGKSLSELLGTFADLRRGNLETLRGLRLTPEDMTKTAIHPDLGLVTLEQLLATWVVHDLAHIRQIARVMAKQYTDAVGPWRKYMPVLGE